MEEHRPPTDAQPPAPEADPPESPASFEALVPKRRLWPVFAVVGLAIAAAGLAAFRSLTATDPLRVLVAIDLDGYWWEGSQPAARLADELGAQLAELGFDPVKGGDPEVVKALESAGDPKAAGRALGAAFVIEAHLSPEVVEHPVKEGYFELRADAPVTLTALDKDTSTEGRISGYSGATKKDRAMALLADFMASQALDAVIAQLMDHPSVRAITEGTDIKLLERLAPARRFTKERAAEAARAAEAYAAQAKVSEAEQQGRVTFLSPPSAEDLLVGTAEGGYFVKTADVSVFFSARSRSLVRSEALETVAWRPLDQQAPPTTDPGAPRPMWRGYHVYSYPSSQRDGDRVALVEDFYGWAKTITIVDRSGQSRRVRIDPEHRFVDPRLAPGGKFVAVYDRPEADAEADLMVLDTESGKEVFGLHTENESLGGFTWLDEKRLVFVYVPDTSTDEVRHLAVVDVTRQPMTIERPFRASPGEDLRSPAPSRDGTKLVCVVSGAEPGIAVIDTATWRRKVYATPGGAAWPTFSPDGARVAFEAPGAGGTDIAVLALATGEVKKITQGSAQERVPRFSADGRRVLFEVRYRDPVFPRKRWISRIASAAVEP
ncbi:TolB family protein [Sorangium sp. So ce1182]|uniref:TolB family protein n=1 Tax=Sorangium sp. So ce1182 TaxID=3133334 RepID=UPI003F62E49A